MMNQMQNWLAKAAVELGLRIVIGYVLKLPDGREIPAQALLPDLGGNLGTLVFDSAGGLDAGTRRALASQGFSISAFSEPLPNEEFNVENYAEMFAEWGWASNDITKPIWMNEK
ncbi:hypothetical protein [Massilia horti]|uniref:Uncharacterized protein n=1 Tax=Massilia horti TaxID=2562153 RepID=A0A4Y9T4Z1_9BURK|nr:hypothetical protein [Massilia horti]TFW35833.1 hypothetical protein E4O92_01390 [Massilia horti]